MVDLNEYMQPLWQGGRVVNESVLFITGEGGLPQPAALLYKAAQIESVRSASLQICYEQGRDYVLENGAVALPHGSRIPVWNREEYYLDKKLPQVCFERAGGGYIAFGEGSFMHDRQLAVTYTHSDAWSGFIPRGELDRLPRTARLFSSGSDMTVLFYGDSITTGANSSGVIGTAPFAPDWCDMTVGALQELYGCKINKINTIK